LPLIEVFLGHSPSPKDSDRKPGKEQQPHPTSFPKWEQPKINLQNLAHFSSPKNRPPKHHVHHAIHNVFTMKTPQENTRFCQNPQQKRTSPRQKNCRNNRATLTPKGSKSLHPPNAGEILLLPPNHSAQIFSGDPTNLTKAQYSVDFR
jgi:hypothetical protein